MVRLCASWSGFRATTHPGPAGLATSSDSPYQEPAGPTSRRAAFKRKFFFPRGASSQEELLPRGTSSKSFLQEPIAGDFTTYMRSSSGAFFSEIRNRIMAYVRSEVREC